MAIRTRNDEVSITWAQLQDRVDAVAGGLASLGVRRGDTVAMLLSNRPEFHIVDLAAMVLGAASFSIYSTYAPNQIQFVVADAGARVAFVERASARRAPGRARRAARPRARDRRRPRRDDPARATASSRSRTSARGAGFDVDAAIAEIEPGDVLTLIYTSGTTGPPKGSS